MTAHHAPSMYVVLDAVLTADSAEHTPVQLAAALPAVHQSGPLRARFPAAHGFSPPGSAGVVVSRDRIARAETAHAEARIE